MRARGTVLVVALALAAPPALRAQAPTPAEEVAADSAVGRFLQGARRTLFPDTANYPLGRMVYKLLGSFLDPEPVRPRKWYPVVLVEPVLDGQPSFGIGVGAALRLPPPPGPVARSTELRAWYRTGVTGSNDITLSFEAPEVLEDWSFLLLGRKEHMTRAPYFGPFNQQPYDQDLVDQYSVLYYRYNLDRNTVLGTIRWRATHRLFLHVATQFRSYGTSALDGETTLYAQDLAEADLDEDTLDFAMTENRIGLVFDTRDDQSTPVKGVLLELMAGTGLLTRSGSNETFSYRRGVLGAAEFISLSGGRTTLGFRQRVSVASRSLPFFLAYEQPTTWKPDDGVMTSKAVRLHGSGTQLATNQAVSSVELRYKLAAVRDDRRDPLRLWVVGFADGGFLWEPVQGTEDLPIEWTIGTGLRGQVTRTALGGFDVGVTNRGPNFTFSGSFAF
jgi:hypothetical protein